MSQSPIHVLLVEDNPDHAELIQRALTRLTSRVHVTAVTTGADCLSLVSQGGYSVVLLDYSLPGMDGLAVLKEIRKRDPMLPVVMVTGQGDERIAVEAMQEGASDYLIKTTGYLTTLPTMLSKVLKQHEIALENARLFQETEARAKEISALYDVAATLNKSLDLDAVLQEVIRKIRDIFQFDATRIFLQGPQTDELHLRASFDTRQELWSDTNVARRGQGVVGTVGATGAPIIFENVQSDARYQELSLSKATQKAGFSFFAGLPIIAKLNIVGVMVCIGQAPRVLNPNELQLLISMATQIGVAVENARLFQETQRGAQEQATLNAIATAVSQSLEVDTLLRLALEKVLEVTGREVGYVRTLDEARGLLHLVAHHGLSEAFVRPYIQDRPPRGKAGKVLSSGAPLVVNDISDGEIREDTRAEGLRAMAWIPLTATGKVLGILNIATRFERPFESREVEFLTAVGNVIGVALENARLFQQTEQRARDLSALHTVATAVSSTLELDQILVKALDAVLDVNRTEAGHIRLLEGNPPKLVLKVFKGISPTLMEKLQQGTRAGGWSEQVITTKRTLVIDLSSVGAAGSPMPEILGEGFGSAAWIPVISQDRVIGVITVAMRGAQPFSRDQISQLESIGASLGMAVDNARLYEETRQRAEETAALHAIAEAVTRSLDVEEVLQTAVQKVVQVLRAEDCTLRLREGDELVVKVYWNRHGTPLAEAAMRRKLGEGMAGRVAVTKEPLVIDRNQPVPKLLAREWAQQPRILATVPMMVRGEVVGTLGFGTSSLLSAHAVAFLKAIGDQVGIALENARLFSETRARARKQSALNAIAMAVSQSLEADEILRLAFEKVLEVTGRERGYIAIMDRETGERRIIIHRGIPEAIRQAIRFRSGKIDQALSTGEPVVVNDQSDEKLWDETRWDGVQALAWVPIRAKGRVEGVLQVSTRRSQPFGLEEVELLQAIGNVIGVALENARLYEAGQRRARISQSLYEIGKAISSTLDLSTLLSRIAEKAIEMIGAVTCALFEMNEEDRRLCARAASGLVRQEEFVAIRIGQGTVGNAAARRAPVLTSDFTTDAIPGLDDVVEEAGLTLREVAAHQGHRAALAVPLISRETVLGVLCVFWKDVHHFSQEEVDVLSSFADQAAIAFQNARLFQEATRSYEELMRTQEQMIHVEKLRALGEMAGGVAHDFNNLLAAILGRAQYALLRMEELSEFDLRRCLTVIEQSALDGAETVRRLLDFTRGKARKGEFTSIEVNELLTYAVEATRPRWKDEAEAKGITIQVNLLLGQVSKIAGNPSELREILLNLILNAVESMPQGGTMTLRSWMEAGRVCLGLADTGIGMPEEVRRRIFDPFFTTKGPQRSGLGLSVSYGIIRRHDGEIEVESEEGKGTAFTITFPAREVSSAPHYEADFSVMGSYRVLVVDDDASVRETLGDILRAAGHRVWLADDGAEAIRLLREGSFDVVCTDLGMPGMNGWELSQRIKAEWPHVKIALITGWGVQLEPHELEASGVDLLIGKPFEVKEILRALAETRGPDEHEEKKKVGQ